MPSQLTVSLYAAFRGYPLRLRLDTCPHCELEAAEAALHRAPLSELTWTDLGWYLFKAMTTFGDVDDFKHFLPRLLELYGEGLAVAPWDLDTLFGKLVYADWTTWPEVEKTAVLSFLTSWHDALAMRASGSEQAALELTELEGALDEYDVMPGQRSS